MNHPLKEWRKANGFTLAQLGELLGCTAETCRRWEARERIPTEDYMRVINQHTGLTPNDFYQLTDSTAPQVLEAAAS